MGFHLIVNKLVNEVKKYKNIFLGFIFSEIPDGMVCCASYSPNSRALFRDVPGHGGWLSVKSVRWSSTRNTPPQGESSSVRRLWMWCSKSSSKIAVAPSSPNATDVRSISTSRVLSPWICTNHFDFCRMALCHGGQEKILSVARRLKRIGNILVSNVLLSSVIVTKWKWRSFKLFPSLFKAYFAKNKE